MKCKYCGAEMFRCRMGNGTRYKCLNEDCPVIFAKNSRWGKEKIRWVLEARVRVEPL